MSSKIANIKKQQLADGIKKFSKAYFGIKYNFTNSKYIFRPDQLNFEEKHKFLNETLGFSKNAVYFEHNKDNYSDEQEFNEVIEKIYFKNVCKQIKKQEDKVRIIV